jgi:GTP-binding protein
MHNSDLSASDLQRYFQTAAFSISAAKFDQCPAQKGLELAFAGRSNAGKSSAINRICSNKKLARTSKTPGRTQLLNFFDLSDEQRLVDLPGYGFAKVSIAKKQQWQRHLMRYLEDRPALAGLVLLVDCRHPLQTFDQMMLDWSAQYQLPCIVLLTKADKLSRSAGKQAQFNLEKQLASMPLVHVQLFSAHNDTGLNEARAAIYARLHPNVSLESEQKTLPDD